MAHRQVKSTFGFYWMCWGLHVYLRFLWSIGPLPCGNLGHDTTNMTPAAVQSSSGGAFWCRLASCAVSSLCMATSICLPTLSRIWIVCRRKVATWTTLRVKKQAGCPKSGVVITTNFVEQNNCIDPCFGKPPVDDIVIFRSNDDLRTATQEQLNYMFGDNISRQKTKNRKFFSFYLISGLCILPYMLL